uniref:NADH-ubiquinone oxidoreductase chain 5 n=1 Tax=Discolomatidae sp. 4 ACP-2013 TaxID=1434487 RepID=A0A3G3FXK4_9CUCU|nr:NADH dehydrogenase subunit 5 [Discolomatidae sp. 4 ACP-2013]
MILYLIYGLLLLLFSMVSFFSGLFYLMNMKIVMIEWNLFSVNSSYISMILLLDYMSLIFMSFVFFISSMVIFYSKSYMGSDLNLSRFIYLVMLFVFSMFLLIISPNLISILLGWDGLGLVSYCLVIYYQNSKSYNAGMLTALTNRLGDVLLLISIAYFVNYGSWNFLLYINFVEDNLMKLIFCLVILASFTKSAQIPFSAWLPAAMAAPTPVSALVHSSTLVTAGVYLLIRFNYLSNLNVGIFMLMSSLTMMMSGIGANYEFDLKKIIALSTLSQLGLMMTILFFGSVELAFFHLLIHALFKALLFMCAGMMIHSLNNIQDIRYMGKLIYFMPLTCSIFNISNLSLCGIPFMSGFYSKDLIIEFMGMNSFNFLISLIFYFCIGLTMMYSIRLMYYLMIKDFNFFSVNLISEMDYKMLSSMLIMCVIVIFSGSMMSWLMFNYPYFICLSLIMKLMVLLMIIFGLLMGLLISMFKLSWINYNLNYFKMSMFFMSMWFMPNFSLMFNLKFLNISNFFYKYLDQGWLEMYGAQGIYNFSKKKSMNLEMLFNNHLKIYFMLMVIWVIFVIFKFF